jgi:hypothetical protein
MAVSYVCMLGHYNPFNCMSYVEICLLIYLQAFYNPVFYSLLQWKNAKKVS